MRHFLFYDREQNEPAIVETVFFTDGNGFSIDDICEVTDLKIGETVILGIDDAIVTRVWDTD